MRYHSFKFIIPEYNKYSDIIKRKTPENLEYKFLLVYAHDKNLFSICQHK